MFPKIVVPQNGWFIRENPIKMDDLVVPLFLEAPIHFFVDIPYSLSLCLTIMLEIEPQVKTDDDEAFAMCRALVRSLSQQTTPIFDWEKFWVSQSLGKFFHVFPVSYPPFSSIFDVTL